MRVIAGALGGRRLKAPAGRATRPTSDRVREAIFSALGPVDGCRVLDIYAGSGALGIEALSRGANHCIFVERAAAAVRVLRRNLTDLALLERASLLSLDVGRLRLREDAAIDILLADPPYAQLAEAAEHITQLLAGPYLADDVVIVLEHAQRDPPPKLAAAACQRTRRYGDTAVSSYRRQP